ncbi:hypothetical protein [Caballeronia pedi]|uniref:hypothetical protein n=1 Tax=Caballeronia pedi TaxID=1777141 RepID=UPI00117832AC|nr:hypothetical protein [Caballeronia pedi]
MRSSLAGDSARIEAASARADFAGDDFTSLLKFPALPTSRSPPARQTRRSILGAALRAFTIGIEHEQARHRE